MVDARLTPGKDSSRQNSPLFLWFPFSACPLPYLISFPYKKKSACSFLVIWAIPLKNPYILVFNDVCLLTTSKWYLLWIHLPPTINICAVGQISLKFSALCLSLAVSNACNTLPTISWLTYPNSHSPCKVCLTAEATELTEDQLGRNVRENMLRGWNSAENMWGSIGRQQPPPPWTWRFS